MQDSNIENTKPNKPQREMGSISEQPAPQPPANPPVPRLKARQWPWILAGLLLIFLAGGAGTWIGYQQAVQMRQSAKFNNNTSLAVEHFLLGMKAQDNKQYEIARQQFEFVIKIYPTFPGAMDKLREVLTVQMLAQTPTAPVVVFEPTAAAEQTQDTRPQEEIYNQGRAQYAAQDWTGLFQSIDTLRTIDPSYHAVEIDGWYYMALRYRGVDKILHQANLEGGLYDLALAEKIGPLDVDAINYQAWARRYLNGASFWAIDWVKVMAYFEEIYPYFPNLRDSSGLTAQERYRIAAKSQGDKLVAAGDYCGAQEFYQKSMNAVPDGELAMTATAVAVTCEGGQPTSESVPLPSETPTLTLPVPVTTEPPTVEPTATETPTAEPSTAPAEVTPGG
jgi:hypothetical protein